MTMSLALSLALGSGNAPAGGSPPADSAILLEDGTFLLLEDNTSHLLLEA